ncbi:aspartate aminotransferase, class I and II aminotransferase [Campylobacter sp. RM5004]|uniref:pyridoxal phosphate-dependent aminotransferase n=1 Tax=Campylobacter sp. RM5004 TaxID=1660078 RepID=UPI001EFA8246|nr:pyridoxal phosphate-dependent aminotransferase [Campylobacter sp. RM5004]ULO01595.1 aspartate aminotransferase, class I and II aminotransferase [Campylobacter sp. RM5004]
MQFSQKIKGLEESITLAITAKAKLLKEQGVKVISFSAGEPDFDTPQIVKNAAIKAINDGCGKYTPVAGTTEVLKAICTKLKRDHNLDYEISEVIANVGAKHSLFNAIQALVCDGDEVIIPAPYWVTYPEQVKYSGGVPVIITPKNNFKLSVEELKAAITPKTKILILNNPSNPTGALYTKDELMALAKVLEGTNIVVLADEMYEKLVYDGEFVAFASLSEDALNRTVTINGLSKCAAMPGYRFGYSASKNKELNKLMKNLQGQCTSNICSITQAAAIPALVGEIDSDIAMMKEEFKKRRDKACEMISDIKGLKLLSKPSGAFYLFIDCSSINPDDVEFCAKLLDEKKVACVPGSGFGMKGYFRISYATSMENIIAGIEKIAEFVKEYK